MVMTNDNNEIAINTMLICFSKLDNKFHKMIDKVK